MPSRVSSAPLLALAWVLASASGCALEPLGGESDYPDDGFVNVPPPGPGAPVMATFVWPVDAWVAATDRYAGGEVHGGTADLAAPYYLPVAAARSGVVARAERLSYGGYLVELDHDEGYTTLYSHLVESALVDVGDEVTAGQTIGFVGRTGRAFNAGAHLHFAIERDDARVAVEELEHGDWVVRGEPIPGEWPDLEPVPFRLAPYAVTITSAAVDVRAEPSQRGRIVALLAQGDVVQVDGSHRGYLRVLGQDRSGWIVQSATVPAGSTVFGVRVVAERANVREGPGTSHDVVGELPRGTLVTGFEERSGWIRILHDVPASYRWTWAGNVEPTHEFETALRASSANLRAAPAIDQDVVGKLGYFDRVVVKDVHAGWYLVEADGKLAWLAGWLTQGRF